MRIPVLLLLLFPFLELWLMIVIGDEIGALAVILWLVAMIVIGMNLLRYLGAASMLKAAQNMRTGELPGVAIAEGLFKAIGAILLIIPGFISDALALLCFIPWFRRLLIRRWAARMTIRAAGFARQQSPFNRTPYGPGNIYDHDGPARTGTDNAHEGTLIEQEKPQVQDNSTPSGSKKP